MIEVVIYKHGAAGLEQIGFGVFDDPELLVEKPDSLIHDGTTVELVLHPLVNGQEQTGNTISGTFKYLPDRKRLLAGSFSRLAVADGDSVEFSALTLTWVTS